GGAVGKVPARATRRRPTLPPVRFGRGRLVIRISLDTDPAAYFMLVRTAPLPRQEPARPEAARGLSEHARRRRCRTGVQRPDATPPPPAVVDARRRPRPPAPRPHAPPALRH